MTDQRWVLAMDRRSATGWLASEDGHAVNGGRLAGADPKRTLRLGEHRGSEKHIADLINVRDGMRNS